MGVLEDTMKLTQEQRTMLEPIYDLLKDCCNCIYVAGSFIDPYITNKEDIDICVIFNSSYERRKYARIRKENIELFDNLKQQGFSIFSDLRARVEEKFKVYAYQFNFDDFEVLFGEPDFEFRKNIFDYPEEYKECLKNAFNLLNRNNISTNLYRILEGIYFLENNNFILSLEQIENINIVHDNNSPSKILELFNHCLNYLFEVDENVD